MKQTGRNSPKAPKMRRKKNTPTENRVRFLVDQCPHRIVGVMHLPGCDVDAPEHESHNEHAAIRLLALCCDVVKIHSQHEQINYLDADEITRKYTPDFGITLTDESVVSVEVKPLAILLRKQNQDKYIAIAKSYATKQQRFEILTDHAVRLEPRHTIARCLRLYLTAAVPDTLCELISAILGRGKKSIRDVLAELGNDSHLAYIYSLIAQRHLCISWNEPLGRDMQVSLPDAPYAPLTFAAIACASRFHPIVQELVLGRRPEDQRLLAAALAQDKSISLPATLGNVDGYPRRSLQVGRNFRMSGIRETRHSESPPTSGGPVADALTEEADHESA